MDKQQLSDRIQAIQAEMEQTKANYAKLEGHLNECVHWLQTMVAFEQQVDQANAKIDEAKEQDNLPTMDVGEVDGEVNEQEAEQAA